MAALKTKVEVKVEVAVTEKMATPAFYAFALAAAIAQATPLDTYLASPVDFLWLEDKAKYSIASFLCGVAGHSC